MNKEGLSVILRDMYENAPLNEKVVNIHLFGIIYGDTIRLNKYKATEIIALAHMSKSYAAELSKGIQLSRFVHEN